MCVKLIQCFYLNNNINFVIMEFHSVNTKTLELIDTFFFNYIFLCFRYVPLTSELVDGSVGWSVGS